MAAAWAAYQASRFGFVIAELHRLLPLALATLGVERGRPGEQQAVVQTAYLYQLASSVLTKLGELDLAFICADRGEQIVQESTDQAARISVQRTIAHALFANSQFDDAIAVIEQTLSQVPRTTGSPDLLSAIGTTHLVGAMISGRSRNRTGTQRHLLGAQATAEALGRDGNHL